MVTIGYFSQNALRVRIHYILNRDLRLCARRTSGLAITDVAQEFSRRWQLCTQKDTYEEKALVDEERYEQKMAAEQRRGAMEHSLRCLSLTSLSLNVSQEYGLQLRTP